MFLLILNTLNILFWMDSLFGMIGRRALKMEALVVIISRRVCLWDRGGYSIYENFVFLHSLAFV